MTLKRLTLVQSWVFLSLKISFFACNFFPLHEMYQPTVNTAFI